MRLKLMGGAIVTGWIIYVSTLAALEMMGQTVQRGALHATLVLLWAVITFAWIVAAAGEWLWRRLCEAQMDDGSGGFGYRPGWGGPAGVPPSPVAPLPAGAGGIDAEVLDAGLRIAEELRRRAADV